MKNILKNFFYIEEENEEEVDAPKKQHAQNPQQVSAKKEHVQAPQPQAPITPMATPKKPQRKVQQMPTNVANMNPVAQAEPRVNNLVSFTQSTSKVNLFEPRVYSEAQDIAECIRNKKTAVVNLQRIDKENGKRIIDFLSGTVYALNGEIKKIGVDIFLCTPDNVEIDGAISEYYYDGEQY